MKEGSRVILKNPPSIKMITESRTINDIPKINKRYTIKYIQEELPGVFYIWLEELPPDCGYLITLWVEVDDLSNHTIESLLEEILDKHELIEVI